MPRHYAGVGARDTPQDVLARIITGAENMANEGWVLRSGGAIGADDAFETGCKNVGGKKEIYLPKDYHNGRRAGGDYYDCTVLLNWNEAFKIASEFHPNWYGLVYFVKCLMGRNVYQILGQDLETPVELVLCWTPDGATTKTTRATGGTGQAIRIANAHGIRVRNLQKESVIR